MSATEAPPSLWGRLADRIAAAPLEVEEGQGIWARLDQLTDLALFTRDGVFIPMACCTAS